MIKEKYMELCESLEYLYLLKAPDKKAMYARMLCVEHLIRRVLGDVK